jgi:hypothetical protein
MGAYNIPFGALPTVQPMQAAQQFMGLQAMMQERALRQQQMSDLEQEQDLRAQQIQAANIQNQTAQISLDRARAYQNFLRQEYGMAAGSSSAGTTSGAAQNAPPAAAPAAAAPASLSPMTDGSAGYPGGGTPYAGAAGNAAAWGGPSAPPPAGPSLGTVMSGAPAPSNAANSAPRAGAPAGPAPGLPGSGYDWQGFWTRGIQAGVNPADLLNTQANLLKWQQEAANLDKTQADTLDTHYKMAANAAQGLLQLSPGARMDQLPVELDRLLQANAISQQDHDRILADTQRGIADDDLHMLVARGTMGSQQIEAGQKAADFWSKQIQSDIATTRSQNDYSGLRDKYQQLGAPENLVDQYLPANGTWTPDIAYKAAQSITPEGERIKQEQEANALWANRLANAGSAERYSELLGQAPSEIQRQYRNLVAPGAFDPQTSPDILRNAGLTPEQRTQADLRRTIELARIDNLNARTGALENKPQYTPQFLANQHAKLDQWQTQEQQQWKLHGQLGELIDPTKTPDGTPFSDPTGKTTAQLIMDSATRQRMRDAYQKAETTAQGLARQQDDMERQYSWGKYAGQPLAASRGAAAVRGGPAANGGAGNAGTPAVGASRVLNANDAARLNRAGHTQFRAGQTVHFDGTSWH